IRGALAMRPCSCLLRARPVVLTALALGLLPSGPAHAQEGPGRPSAPPADESPARRTLTGDDAKPVEELEKTITELRRAGKFTEAREPARTVLEIRTRIQGAGHWQTGDARRAIKTLEQIAALPTEAQNELSDASRLDAEVFKLHQQGRYIAALPNLRQ